MSDERVFTISQAERTKVPLWIALAGPSGGGKTLSALRIATGITKVFGGKIAVIDTEAERARHYAPLPGQTANPPKTFDFLHLPFGAPFGSMDYLAAIKQCAAAGATVAIVDSFSHEHESIGGLLEQFEDELERLSRGDEKKAERVKMLAWKKPKMARRRMINEMLQMPISVIGCFRAKEKLKIVKGQDPEHLGYMPITGDDMIFEFPTRCLLKPRSDGKPCWDTNEPGEQEWTRLPAQFRSLFETPRSLDEAMGESMAKWALGTTDGAIQAAQKKQSASEVVAKLLAMGAAEEDIFASIGVNHVSEITDEQVVTLITKGKEIKNNRRTVSEAFPSMKKAEEAEL